MIREALTSQATTPAWVSLLKSAGMSCGSVMVARKRGSNVTSKHIPARARGIVILTDGPQGSNLISEIRRAVSRAYHWPDFQPTEHALARIPPALLSGYVGTYEVRGEGRLAVSWKHDGGTDDQLYLQAAPRVLNLRNFWWTQTATFWLCRNPSNSLLTEMAKAQSSA